MRLTILFFGPLTDITGVAETTLPDASDTQTALKKLVTLYPELATAAYAITVDGRVVEGNKPLADGATLALLPPFSGG